MFISGVQTPVASLVKLPPDTTVSCQFSVIIVKRSLIDVYVSVHALSKPVKVKGQFLIFKKFDVT